MKVLFFTKYTQKGASSRMRSFQYFPFLEKEDIHVSVSPFFNDAYLENLYAGKKSKLSILFAYLKRFLLLFTVFKYDKIVIEYELFPYFPAWFEQLFNIVGIHYIVDYDDAIFHNYNLHPNPWLRKLLGNKIAKVMKNSKTVVAGNKYLAQYAESAGTKNIVIIPTVIDLQNYKPKENYATEKLIIGWIGSPSTFKYLEEIRAELTTFVAQNNAEVLVIGAYPTEKQEGVFRFIPWVAATENEWIIKFDVGLMPLNDTPWSKGKCSFKLIQYMASGVPVIASPVGMNKEVVTAENGYLATNSSDWGRYLAMYFANQKLRENFGRKGREMVEDNLSLQVTAKKWTALIKSGNDI